jgi:23S rRNA pseudouridine1911/1915/1917 synthase
MLIESIPAALADQRLDRVVSLIADISRAATATLIEIGGVTVDGVVATAGKVKMKEGQEVTVDTAMIPAKELPQPDTEVEIDVVFADDHIIVLNKAPGIVVHPGAGNPSGTLVNGVLALFPDVAAVGDQLRPGIVHRLDAGTSGLMVVARSQVAYDFLVDALTRRDVSRIYSALVWGRPEVSTGVIDAPIGRDQRDPTKMAVVIDGKFARTHYDVVQKFDLPQPCSLVECQLETGRTHQIRVHLDSIGHPVVGDSTYGGARSSLSSPRPMLHAAKLSFTHPVTHETVSFAVPIPEDMQSVIDRCGNE